jgi:hypothetical protein
MAKLLFFKSLAIFVWKYEIKALYLQNYKINNYESRN